MTETAPLPSAAPLAHGAIVADRYRIDAVLGDGGMGVVYRAEHVLMRKRVALKVLHASWSGNAEVVARFEREAVAAARIEHPHVAKATDFGRLADGSFFLVLEYVDGRTLRSELAKGPLGELRALRIARGVVEALLVAHALGIVHRDIKPENVMLVDREGEADFVKVLDFGVAKLEGTARHAGPTEALTMVGAIVGTPEYMSPEQALGQPADARSDLYALGVMLFEMLAGACPYEGDALDAMRGHLHGDIPPLPAPVLAAVDPRLPLLVTRLLQKDADARFATAEELLVALTEILSSRQRASLASVRPMTTPAAGRALHRATSFVGSASLRARIAAGALCVAVVALLLFVALHHAPTPSRGGVGTSAVANHAAPPPAVTETPAPLDPSVSDPPQVASTERAANSPPSTRTKTPKGVTTRDKPRRTGPGGIYVPPPKSWFK